MKRYLLLVWVFLFSGLLAYAQVNVTFNVDMSVWEKNGYFNPKTDTLRIAGDFNGWSTTANDLTPGAGADSAKYSAQISITSSAIAYKYLFTSSTGLQWEGNFPTSSTNREAAIGSSDTTLPVVFFNGITGKINHVWFKVDMSLPIKQGKLNIATDTVAATGDFTGWGTRTNSLFLTKGISDSVYSGFVDTLASGRTVNFKFIYLNGTVNWEDDPNRTYMVPEKDSSSFSDYWNRQNPNIQTGSGKINFNVDMGVLTEIGIFDPIKDEVQLRGGFNGWTDSDPNTSHMAQNPINDSLYFISIDFNNEPLGTKPYKYFVKKVNPTGIDTVWKDGYERPIFRGGDNRLTLFMGDPSKDTTSYYDGVQSDWVIPAGTNLQVKFSVDMNPAMDAGKQAVPFDAAADTLYWISEEPIFARSQGWYRPSSGGMQYFKLNADGGGIYSGTLTIKDPSFNAYEYRYAWHKGSDKSWIFEPDALGTFDTYRVRFAGQNQPRSFPVNPWNMPMDTWTNASVKTDQETNPYESLKAVGIKDKNIQPKIYSLSQNYPNPFNPSTNIDFSIQKPGLVLLKIYNILGQEVLTLVNQEMNTGTYTYNFNASRLSSGVYFYTIRSGDFVQTKKMMLIK
jgi:Secretion system C-terminal sorting domain